MTESLREEILDDVTERFLNDPAFNARVALTRQIIAAEERLKFNKATGDTYAGVALVLAERKLGGGERENDPRGLMHAVEGLLKALQETVGGYTYNRLRDEIAAVQAELQNLA